MNKIKFIKRLLIVFIFIIAFIALITSPGAEATTVIDATNIIASSENPNSSWSDLPETMIVENGYSFLSENWWILCNNHGWPMKSVYLYLTQQSVTDKLTPNEAYLLANMSNNNVGAYSSAGQIAWWSHATTSMTSFRHNI